MRCPECGRFVGEVVVLKRLLDERIFVTGQCKKHGQVEPDDWDADDFQFDDDKLVIIRGLSERVLV